MKKIDVIIQPYNLDLVAQNLAVEGVVGMTVTEAKGFGVEKGFTRGETAEPGQFRFHPKMKVEMVVADHDVDKVLASIAKSLEKGRIGAGKIFVLPIDEAIRTRTGERGEAAIK